MFNIFNWFSTKENTNTNLQNVIRDSLDKDDEIISLKQDIKFLETKVQMLQNAISQNLNTNDTKNVINILNNQKKPSQTTQTTKKQDNYSTDDLSNSMILGSVMDSPSQSTNTPYKSEPSSSSYDSGSSSCDSGCSC